LRPPWFGRGKKGITRQQIGWEIIDAGDEDHQLHEIAPGHLKQPEARGNLIIGPLRPLVVIAPAARISM